MYTGHVDRVEWRWVIIVSLTFLLIAFSPFIVLALLSPPNEQWQFMGALHDYQDSAALLARMQQGMEGGLLSHFWYTTELHNSALIQPLYAVLGQLSRFTLRTPIIIFHLARMIAALFMYLTLYQLGANIWVKVRTRRIFFIMAALGSGLGWLYALLTGLVTEPIVPDLMIPQAFPFYSAAVNVHYPLAIACLAMITAVLVVKLRPGIQESPTIDNGGLVVFLASLTLAFIYPDALLPIGIAFTGSVIARWIGLRKITQHELRWGLWLLVPALPLVTYDLLVIRGNDVVAAWVEQRTQVPTIPLLLLSLGIPLLIALPGLFRALRRFEADGDRFMLLWLLAMIITMYLPIGQYSLAGLMVPLAYFAARSIEDFWFRFIKRRHRGRAFVFGVLTIALSHLFWLYVPISPILGNWSSVDAMVLEQGYLKSFDWLSNLATPDDVVLADPPVGVWIPTWVQSRVVYGHPTETINAAEKSAEIIEWYRITDATDPRCYDLVSRYQVRYVIWGAREQRVGVAACLQNYIRIASFGTVDIYATFRIEVPR